MAFNEKEFYDQLDTHLNAGDIKAAEEYMLDVLRLADENALMLQLGDGCPTCNIGRTDVTFLTDSAKETIQERSLCRLIVLNELGCFYRDLNRADECIHAYELLVAELEECLLENTENYVTALVNLGGAYRMGKRIDDSIDCFDKAYKTLCDNEIASDAVRANFYNYAGMAYQDKGEHKKAIEYFENSIKHQRALAPSSADLASALSNLSMAFYSSGDIDSAEKYVDEAIGIFENVSGNKIPHYASALNNKATFEYAKGNLESAAAIFEKAVEKTHAVFGESREYASACRNCSVVYQRLGNEAKAKEYADMAAKVC